MVGGEGDRGSAEGRGDGSGSRQGRRGGGCAPGADAEEGGTVLRVAAADGDAAGWGVTRDARVIRGGWTRDERFSVMARLDYDSVNAPQSVSAALRSSRACH